MNEHKVEQGDCLTSIAFENGFFWQTLWNHGDNASLKKQRHDPFTLAPGDVVRVPDLRQKEDQRPTNQRHRFRLRGVPSKLRIRLLEADGSPRKNLAYKLVVDGVQFSGTTNGDGKLQHPIAPNAKGGKLAIPSTGEAFDLNLGYLEPIETISGVQDRLSNLGFYRGRIDGKESQELTGAIQDFQMAMGLEPLGNLDEKTRSNLKQACGG